MDMNLLDIAEMESTIGVTEELTENIMCKVQSFPPSRNLLSVYYFLLLERFDNTLPLIEKVMREKIDLEFLNSLQNSRFYLHRMAVPLIVLNQNFYEKKALLRRGLKDEICDVVKKTVFSIRENNPFDREELLEIALDLFNSKYIRVKILCVDILAFSREGSFLVGDLTKSTNWRIRLKVASRLCEFDPEEQDKIVDELIADPLAEVRTELAKHLTDLKYMDLLKDPSEFVRANYLGCILDKIDSESVLRKVLEDSSWEVRKKLLGLRGEMFRKITIPLIRNKIDNVSWRDKFEIFCLIEEKATDEFISRLLMVFLLTHIRDKVWEIRQQAQRILLKIVQLHPWIVEYFYELESATMSANYLHRISILPVIIEYDLRFKTFLGSRLKEDNVINVRECFKDYCEFKGISLDYGRKYNMDPDALLIESSVDTVRTSQDRKEGGPDDSK